MGKHILFNNTDDGIDRRGFLKCMAWTGTGVLWVMSGGVLKSAGLSDLIDKSTGALRDGASPPKGELSFVQISDSHIGFTKEANPDVVGTLRTAIARINALPAPPSFLLHTGDLTQLSKPSEFDTLDEVLKSSRGGDIHFVPGEHDVLNDNGRQYLDRHGKGTKGAGWYSFDAGGVHFIGLVNVVNLKAGGLGNLGHDQLEWLEDDLRDRSASTPIVVFAHIPLWSVYPAWGWGTDDSAQALSYLKRFGSVTVLNGHIHQTMQKVEGNITFHTAMSTAFPQPAPGSAPSPGPMKVPADRLAGLLGLTSVNYVQGTGALAIIDTPLVSGVPGNGKEEEKKDKSGAPGKNEVSIDNFTFTPSPLRVAAGTKVTWTNRDDVPHTVTSTNNVFSSKALDTDEQFSFVFGDRGTYDYFCSIHPHMTGSVVVE